MPPGELPMRPSTTTTRRRANYAENPTLPLHTARWRRNGIHSPSRGRLHPYDPNLPGTKETPLEFKPGATVYPNYYYTLDGVRKVWTGEITENPDWTDERFVEF